MTDTTMPLSRRQFLRESIAWTAFAAIPALRSTATKPPDPRAVHALVVGDWGWSEKAGAETSRNGNGFEAQKMVARGMDHYARSNGIHTDGLFMLGDSWYGDLAGGAGSPRWLEQFERLYPLETFACPAYSMLGNHDYQMLPPEVNKLEAELEYSRSGRGIDGRSTRWILPSRWYTFDFPKQNPLIHVIVLDSNMPRPDGVWQREHDFTLKPEEQAEQLAWFEEELKKPRTTPFLAVLAHHPIFSNGPHGDHPVLVREWDPQCLQISLEWP